jgi:hypothetical protein
MNNAIVGNFQHPNLQTRFEVVITMMEEEKRDMGESKITTTPRFGNFVIFGHRKWTE